MSKAFTLDSTYVNLRSDDSATTLKIGPRFWATVEKRTDLDSGRLVGTTPQKKDWPMLEMVLETRAGTRKTRLKAGQTFVVPRNTWHRALVKKPGKLMFITPAPAPNIVR